MVYGIGTRSFFASAEHKQMKKERAVLTKEYEAKPLVEVIVGPMCFCRSFEFSHFPREHRKKLKSDHDWRTFDELKNTQMFGDRIS